jgi:hypothetical protein
VAALVGAALAAFRRVGRAVVDLLPSPPSTDAPPPDVDGRHESTISAETLRRIDRTRKEGKGGNR